MSKWIGFKWNEKTPFDDTDYEVTEYIGYGGNGQRYYKAVYNSYGIHVFILSEKDLEFIAAKKLIKYMKNHLPDYAPKEYSDIIKIVLDYDY